VVGRENFAGVGPLSSSKSAAIPKGVHRSNEYLV